MTHYVCKGFWPNTCFSFVLILLHTVLFSPGCVCVCVWKSYQEMDHYRRRAMQANLRVPTQICSFVQDGTGRVLTEPYKIISSTLLMGMFLISLSKIHHEGSMRATLWFSGACAHSSAPCNTKSGRTATGTLLSSHINACSHWAHVTNVKENIIQHEFGSRSLMCWGGISLEGQTDLHMLANSTMITHKLVEILRRHHQTLCWCSGSRFPPEGQCS